MIKSKQGLVLLFKKHYHHQREQEWKNRAIQPLVRICLAQDGSFGRSQFALIRFTMKINQIALLYIRCKFQ